MDQQVDAGRLLRKKWTDPDDLARELYVMFSSSRGILGGIAAESSIPLEEAARQARLAALQSPAAQRLVAVQAQVKQSASQAATATLNRLNQSGPAQALAAVVRAAAPVVPAIRVGQAAVQALAAPARHELTTQQPAQVPGITQQFQQAVGRFRQPIRRRASDVAVQPGPLEQRPERGQDLTEPVVLPAREGGLKSVPPVAPEEFRAAPPAAGPPGRSIEPERLPMAARGPAVDTPLLAPTKFDLGPGTANESYRKHRQDEEFHARLTRLELATYDRIMVQVDRNGIPAMKPNSTNAAVPGQVGKGSGSALDFNAAIVDNSGNQPQVLYNFGLLPVSGGAITVAHIQGSFWVVDPAVFCHGIVSQAFTACTGTTPGTGKATPYTMQNGVMTICPEIPVENWYAVTAAVGKHCGLMACDGTVSLEVLDC